MKRETGLRRTSLITGALVVAGLTGTVAVGVAAYAADQADHSTATSTSTPDSTSPATSTGDSTSPSLSSGGSDSGQATSGGS